jgi:hypothetical protein
MELARRNRLVAPGESARSRKIAPFQAVARAGGHASFRYAPLRAPPGGATLLRTAGRTYRNRCGAENFCCVPLNETAHAVACGNGQLISVEARGAARLTECEVPWLEDEGISNITSRPGALR